MDEDTITAIATPMGSSGIGIVRISGNKAVGIAQSMFRTDKTCPGVAGIDFLETLPSHVLTHGYICDASSQSVIDEVLLVIMRGPHSYTREDVVEIQSHSSPILLNKILELVIAGGARLAMPGEFTRRAFLNGRIDLSQAEAVGAMISARSEDALKLTATHLTGQMKEAVSAVLQSIVDLQVELEAGLEFSEDVQTGDTDYPKIRAFILDDLIGPIEKLLHHYREGYLLRDGVRLGIVGRPNVGKSSLLNYLLRKDRAIVTHLPGTTRDIIEEQISIDGLPLIISDTAGLHDAKDPIEIIGIQKSRENIQLADLVLFVIDGTEGFNDADDRAFTQVKGKKVIVVVNKLDLLSDPSEVRIPGRYGEYPKVYISAKIGTGIDQLKAAIKNQVMGSVSIEPGRSIVPNLRQKLGLEAALLSLRQVLEDVGDQAGEEVILVDLGLAKEALNEIIGKAFSTDLLDEIFGKFCIGK